MISPSSIRESFGNSCIIDDAVTLLPQPDSPTTHKVLPFLTWKDTPLIALLHL